VTPGRALLHFPAATRFHGLAFAGPRELIRADRPADVRPALERVAALAADGAWAVGYIAYHAAPAFDAALRARPGRLPLLHFGIFEGPAPAHETPGGGPQQPLDWRPDVTRAEYDDAIDRIREAIERGDVYQVNHTFRLHAQSVADAERLYHHLRAAQGEGWFACLALGDVTILSISPELFFHLDGRRIVTRPMKGTLPRGRYPEEDDALATRLAGSAKDRAENVMIVDLLRNDLGRVCRPGSIHVPRLFEVERYRTVWQLTSTVQGELRDDVTLADTFAALFPCGSVTGAPKVAATAIIDALEASPREVYCGAIGVVAPGGEAAFNVAIRTLCLDRDGRATYGVGGGVTWDSAPHAEYEEALSKAAVLAENMPDFDLLETMRLEHGGYPRLDGHLARMAESARYFGRPFDEDRVRLALARHAHAADRQPRRARLRVDPRGEPHVSSEPLTRHPDPRRVALAGVPVSRTDRFLCHKTTQRAEYDRRRAARGDVDDVILMNDAGELTELTTGNLVLQLAGRRLTPRRSAGLLAGIFRGELLAAGAVEEAVLTPDQLAAADRVWLVNSLREWVPVEVVP
jgi:para-aminobenzoate synthetase / 4-amino-4-deoxychorismate lyase